MRRLGFTMTLLSLLALAAAPAGAGAAQRPGPVGDWETTTIDADQNFRGLAAVSKREAWVTGESLSGGAAKVFHTTDRGETWEDVSPPDTEGLSFRDVEAYGKNVHVLAIGPGDASRIYRTSDDGATWTETFRNDDPVAFYDCLAFYPGGRHGLAVSDPVDGKLRILATHDKGRTWEVLPNDGMPDSADEYGFAASGDCLVTAGKKAFLITGGSRSRVLRSDDRGLTWTATESGIPADPVNLAAGGFAGAFASPRHGIAVGGDFADPTDTADTTAYTRDGRTWQLGGDLTHVGEDVAFVRRGHRTAIAVGDYGGSTGTSVTRDHGRTWERWSETGFHTVECVSNGVCWGAGSLGTVGRVKVGPR
jgi:photosystem II stability/assembly factor-like uncharacterized protein